MADAKVAGPLRAVHVTGTIDGFFSDISVQQTYKNDFGRPIEAVFRFPLPEGAAVVGWEAVVGDATVEGVIREKEKAADEYGAAIAGGHSAFLLEREAPDVFTASAGNLQPGATAELRLHYVCELPLTADGAARFTLPTTLAPKYTPAEMPAEEAAAVNPLDVAPYVPYALTLELHVRTPAALTAIASPTHPAELEATVAGREGRVRLARAVPMDGVLVVEVAHERPREPHAWAERCPDGSAALAVCLCPQWPADTAPAAGDFLFLVDRSGSMAGSKLEQTRNALQLILRSLPAASAFDIVGFGSSHERLFGHAAPYSDDTLKRAAKHVAAMKADLGGTELLAPLRALLEAPAAPGRPRALFLLTDGEVSNTAEVIAAVRRAAGGTRVFALGIGAGASEQLVAGVARAGRGHAAFIADGERVEGAALGQLRRALQPALADAALDWGAPAAEQWPAALPAVGSGDRLLAYALLPPGAALPPAVTLTGRGPAGPLRLAVPVPEPAAAAAGGGAVSKLAARAAVRELEEGGEAGRVRELGVRYSLATRETSFVAVHRREGAAAAQEPAQLVLVPSQALRERLAPPVPQAQAMSRMRCRGMMLAAPQQQQQQQPDCLQLQCASLSAMRANLDKCVVEQGALLDELDCKSATLELQAARFYRKASTTSTVARATSKVAAALSDAAASFGALFKREEKKRAEAPCSAPASSSSAAARDRARDEAECESKPAGAGAGARRHDAVVALQAASGLWTLDAALAAALGVPLERLRAARPAGTAEGAWGTLLALAFLEAACAAHRDEWQLCADKALGALAPAAGRALDGPRAAAAAALTAAA